MDFCVYDFIIFLVQRKNVKSRKPLVYFLFNKTMFAIFTPFFPIALANIFNAGETSSTQPTDPSSKIAQTATFGGKQRFN